MKMRFGEVSVGSRFEYGGNTYVKAEGSIARDSKGIEILFPTETVVEVVDQDNRAPETQGRP